MPHSKKCQGIRLYGRYSLYNGKVLLNSLHITIEESVHIGNFRSGRPNSPFREDIMLQQTQMERGVSYFNRWMQRFPDIATLAAASEEDVLRQWEGLGYYSRARHILTAARKIMTSVMAVTRSLTSLSDRQNTSLAITICAMVLFSRAQMSKSSEAFS